MIAQKSSVLRRLFKAKSILRIAGAHDGLGAKLIEKNGFDGIWASGLEIAVSHGVPDANILTMTENLEAACVINEATTLPVICDCDTGYGNASNVIHMVKKYESVGIAAVVIEDKHFPKVNSFVPGRQNLIPAEEFALKIAAAKSAQKTADFMVFARVEALIAGWGMEEALRRARLYASAGADGIVIHSKSKTPEEVLQFASLWQGGIPLVAIPTTYYTAKAGDLARGGFKMVIYANQGLRASMRAMDDAYRRIVQSDSTEALEGGLATMREVFEIQGMGNLQEEEKKYLRSSNLQAIIPAAGDTRDRPSLEKVLQGRPVCMVDIGGKPLLERQADLLRSCGVTDICVVGGYRHDKIELERSEILHNPDYARCGNVCSIMRAHGHFKEKTLVVYSDILFDRQVLSHLLESPYPVTLLIDRAYKSLPPRAKKLDLVLADDPARGTVTRRLSPNTTKPILQIGRNIPNGSAGHEFIGIAYFQNAALAELHGLWLKALADYKDKPFMEARSVEEADLTDLLQHYLQNGGKVYGMEIEHGWSEIQSLDDVRRIDGHFCTSPTRMIEA